MTDFKEVTVFNNTSLADLFKQIHKNSRDVDRQISSLIVAMLPFATQNAGSVIQLVPIIKTLLETNVMNNDQIVKLAAIVQRAMSSSKEGNEGFFDPKELEALIKEQGQIKEETTKLIEDNKEQVKLPTIKSTDLLYNEN